MSANDGDSNETWRDPDEAPELDDHVFRHGEVRQGDGLVRPATSTLSRAGRPALPEGTRRQAISLRLSPRVLEHFRGGGPGWQTRISEVLERHVAGARAKRAAVVTNRADH